MIPILSEIPANNADKLPQTLGYDGVVEPGGLSTRVTEAERRQRVTAVAGWMGEFRLDSTIGGMLENRERPDRTRTGLAAERIDGATHSRGDAPSV
ncbi:hypothetical protein [Natrinema halophilum]|uniref:Uncharacterized protein n=1 Tax=Natrinema halophilum TaxID=1699371 RepID=A0A7D5GHV7_9EURY|nr:hypothetical protein [Natrinema halophilum]QLG49388.1 hypothetical protein HYG82_11195 [Natrinema halophilum]